MKSETGPINSMTEGDYIKCCRHPHKMAKKLCKECNQFICNSCALDLHSSHFDELANLNSLYLNNKDLLVKFIQAAEKSLNNWGKNKSVGTSLAFKCMNFVFHEGKNFCRQCKKFLCEKCALTHEEGHNVFPISNYFEFLQNKIQVVIQLISTQNPPLLNNYIEYEYNFTSSNSFISGFNTLLDNNIQKVFDMKSQCNSLLQGRKNILLSIYEEILKFYNKKQNFIAKNKTKFEQMQKVYDKIKFERDNFKIYEHFIEFEILIDSFISDEERLHIQSLYENLKKVDDIIASSGKELTLKIENILKNEVFDKLNEAVNADEESFKKEILNMLKISEENYEKYKSTKEKHSSYDQNDKEKEEEIKVTPNKEENVKEVIKEVVKEVVKEVIVCKPKLTYESGDLKLIKAHDYFVSGEQKKENNLQPQIEEEMSEGFSSEGLANEEAKENDFDPVEKRYTEVSEVTANLNIPKNPSNPLGEEEIINFESNIPVVTPETKTKSEDKTNIIEEKKETKSPTEESGTNKKIAIINSKIKELEEFQQIREGVIEFNSEGHEVAPKSKQSQLNEIMKILNWEERNQVEVISLGYNCHSTFIYNAISKNITEVEFSQFKFSAFHSYINILPYVYISGGKDSKTNKEQKLFYRMLRTGEKSFDLVDLASMKEKRSHHVMIYDNNSNSIFAISGSRVKSCEKYDIATDKWSLLPSLNSSRERPSAIIHKQYLYVFLGFDRTINKYVSSVERLDLTTLSAWETVKVKGTQNLLKKQGMGCYYSEGKGVYIIGGVNALRNETKEVLYYDLETDAICLSKFSLITNSSFNQNHFIKVSEFDNENAGNIVFNFTENFEIVKFDVKHSTFIG